MKRLIDEEKLVAVVEKKIGPAHVGPIREWFRRQPRARYVGSTAAAEILGIPTPHVTRLREQGRMPEALDVEGSVNIYNRDEVVKLAKELAAEKRERARRKAAREEAAK